LVNGFEEAKCEARRAKVGGPKGRERGGVLALPLPTSYGVWGSAGGAPAAVGFSRILNTQDDLSGQQDYGPWRFYFFGFLAEW